MIGPNAVSASQLAHETGVRQQNLSRWLMDARTLPHVTSEGQRTKRRSVETKARIITKASALTGSELDGFLRRESVTLAELEQWRMALEEEGRATASTTKRVRALERELARKEKALAEAAALLVLKKQWRALGRTRTTTHPRRATGDPRGGGRGADRRRTTRRCLPSRRISVRTLQRWQARPDGDDRRCGPRHEPPNALTSAERSAIVALLTSPSLAEVSPKQLVPQLVDEGRYLASESTLYRLRRRLGLGAYRPRESRTYVTRATATHRATGPNQVWSWDISYLPTTVRGTYLYLYLVVDVWSRRIVGWDVHERETAEHSAALMQRICNETGVDSHGLVLHADNGTPMRGSTMLATLQWLGIVASFSRPHVSNDNPYSEALFRTLKHTPAYPQGPFASREAACRWVRRFVDWYNGEHRHSAIRYVTPDQRHAGEDARLLARRHALYQQARAAKPERWSGATRNWNPVGAVVLNPQPLRLPTVAAA